MSTGFIELAAVVLTAAVLGVAAKLLKQPIILAYIVAGIAIAYFGFFRFGDLNNHETFRVFSDLGIMFVLFLIGMEINYTSLRLVGKASLLVGFGQLIFTFIIGFFIALLFHFSYLHSAYISLALTFSSTIIVVKLLSEKKDTNSLYGRISVGLLLVQDFVAIMILIFLAGIEAGNGFVLKDIVLTIAKGAVLVAAILWLGRKVFPRVFDKIARSQELLFLVSLAWCFLLVAAVSKIGFSIEIGGFLAGLALANSSEHFQISSRVRSLRDFFILIFFAILGTMFVFSNFSGLTLPIIVFSIFVLIGNPLIVLIIMGLLGYRKRTSFLTGVTVAQISEFSLILAAMGLKLGHIAESVVALITAVGIITIILSTYLIVYSDEIFRRLSGLLAVFERRRLKENNFADKEFHKPIILIGSHRIGQSIAFNLPKDDLLIIDFDPEVVGQLRKHNYDYIFGDIADDGVFEKANFGDARLVISTSPELEDNLTLLTKLKLLKTKPKTILRAQSEKEAEILYKEGADYVLLPHFTSGQYLGKTIAVDMEMKILEQLKNRDLEIIQKLRHREG